MPRRGPAPPKLLLSTVSAVLTAVTLIYGSLLGFLSSLMIYLYILLGFYVACACTEFTSIAYTIAGAVASLVFLLFVNLLESNLLGTAIGIVAAVTVFYITDMIVKCDWRYFSLGDFKIDFSALPIESSIQMRYSQHVPVADTTSRPVQEIELPEDLENEQRRQSKKTLKSPPSRKERRAEAKKQRNVKKV